jgi:hypothetical protein
LIEIIGGLTPDGGGKSGSKKRQSKKAADAPALISSDPPVPVKEIDSEKIEVRSPDEAQSR